MNKREYINYNGKLIAKCENVLSIDNRAFKYGDGIFESMYAVNNTVQFLNEHIKRLTEGMKIIGMEIPKKFGTNTDFLLNEINRLTNKNLQFKGSRIRLNVFRQSGGLYTPKTNQISYIVESQSLDNEKYTLNKKGLLIDVYDQHLKPITALNSLKSVNSLFFVLAGIYKQKNGLDECLILNNKGDVTESISSNVFIVKNKKVYTPPLNSGCLPGIMRQNVIDLLKTLNINVESSRAVSIYDFEQADEVFLTNAISGIKWVVGFKHRRYYNYTAKKLIDALNKQQFL